MGRGSGNKVVRLIRITFLFLIFVAWAKSGVSAFSVPKVCRGVPFWQSATKRRLPWRSGVHALQAQSGETQAKTKCNHVLALLTIPTTSGARIGNEAILAEALRNTSDKLSVVLRSDDRHPTLAESRRYVGEVYSLLWDWCTGSGSSTDIVVDVVVYPQHLPNTAPEAWIDHRPDLDGVCSHDSHCGWISDGAGGRGTRFVTHEGEGVGGLDAHVSAMNADRESRGLSPVIPLHVDPWPIGAENAKTLADKNVVFVEDEDPEQLSSLTTEQDKSGDGLLLGGSRIPTDSLFQSVAVGGTFDGMHYGHRKLLTLAVSSVNPADGKLLIGVTADEMLKKKKLADYIAPLSERCQKVKDFVGQLAPGLKNRIRVVPITDKFGPPGQAPGEMNIPNDFDALVLSHETLPTGHELNEHRVENLNLPPLTLLCTRRTEANVMSSTNLRRMLSEGQLEKQEQC